MGGTPWTPDEVWWLVQAWQETAKEAKSFGGKKQKMSSTQFNNLVHERFVKLAGGCSPRTIATISTRKDILQESYVFIRSFQGNKQANGGVDWFVLSTSDQRALMQTAGGKQVRPIDERVFFALDKLLADGNGVANSEESLEVHESESESTEVSESEGDKYEKTMEKSAPRKASTRRFTVSSEKTHAKSAKSALEEETGELLSPKKEEDKQKRRRVSKAPSTVGVKDILDRQSQVLAGFLDKRAEERTQEHERSRQEREADQKFWAAETAKDRALLRELFTHE